MGHIWPAADGLKTILNPSNLCAFLIVQNIPVFSLCWRLKSWIRLFWALQKTKEVQCHARWPGQRFKGVQSYFRSGSEAVVWPNTLEAWNCICTGITAILAHSGVGFFIDTVDLGRVFLTVVAFISFFLFQNVVIRPNSQMARNI